MIEKNHRDLHDFFVFINSRNYRVKRSRLVTNLWSECVDTGVNRWKLFIKLLIMIDDRIYWHSIFYS